jgi:UbiD family decarboxylase
MKVTSGPVMENIFKQEEIDLFKSPVPFWHERDGGRYIGTGHVLQVIRDAHGGWVNVGCYRTMVHGHHGHARVPIWADMWLLSKRTSMSMIR